MCDCVYCGPPYSATKGKSHYSKCAHNIYYKNVKQNMSNLAYISYLDIYIWVVVRCDFKNILYQKDMCSKEVGLHAHNM